MHSTASKLGLPTGVTAVEQGQAIGRAEQRVRALSERLHISVEDARRRGVEIILNHIVAQWAVRHAEWIQNLLVQSDVGPCVTEEELNIYSRRSRHWESKARAMLLVSWSECLFEAKSTDH